MARWLLALVVLLGACSTVDPATTMAPTTSTVASSAPSEAGLVLAPCPAAAGDVISSDTYQNGCSDSPDSIEFLAGWDCIDGRVLWAEGALWGYVDEPLVESPVGDAAADPEYAAAYQECLR